MIVRGQFCGSHRQTEFPPSNPNLWFRFLASPRLRKSNEHNRNAERAERQRCGVGGDRADHDRGRSQSCEIQIEQEYFCDDLADAEAIVGRALVKMRSMRVPEPFAPCDSPEQGDGRVGKIIQRQQQGGCKVRLRSELNQTLSGHETYRQAADVTEE